MARLNDDAQWIVLMGFLVSVSFFFLALVLNQSTVVGQTTAESVMEFPKNDIRDIRNTMIQSKEFTGLSVIKKDITAIALARKNAAVEYGWFSSTFGKGAECGGDAGTAYNCTNIHYNNGVTSYNESWTSP